MRGGDSMSKRLENRLQVYLKGYWCYVFCYNPRYADPITTANKFKALTGKDIGYFENRFGNHKFRVV